MVRGLVDQNVKQTVAMMMYDKEWRFEEVGEILRASVRNDVFAADDQLATVLFRKSDSDTLTQSL
ncbi:hypothetical protein TWF106_011453 [Orbilia oligospora]|uniref:Uncharacterized protein n=1 Tax=Orbilia oligospora TaxID=2813651 RepID=A0A6G1MEY8_ORBOL|nr:hypothetical protein TWF788_004988 [Orbilia oligospora]KAF3208349.1 hypothetical protein TWF106_011453 [Orbilia oligospora]KAF3210130.1 hypothetical protein TWF679_006878 [Orbilia oligospora]KAF3225313.1 hypothetical protein TWF191_005363 [Orbilia oligospora]KAF3254484.1 hypothetical protein TWF192_003246 [Orbilia oligospora]